jgi:hypothetical protein
MTAIFMGVLPGFVGARCDGRANPTIEWTHSTPVRAKVFRWCEKKCAHVCNQLK